MTPTPRYFYNVHRQAVYGVLRDPAGKRHFRTLATFAEAHISPAGDLLDSLTDAARDALLGPRWYAAHEALATAHAQATIRAEALGQGRPFRDVWQEWLDYARATRAHTTVVNYLSSGNHLVACWGDALRMDELTLQHVDRLLIWLDARGLSPHGRNLHLNALKAFLRWAKERREIAEPPPVKLLRLPRTQPRLPDPADVARMLAWLAEQRETPTAPVPPRLIRNAHRAVVLARATMLRVGEIVSLPLAHLDLERGEVRVRIAWGTFSPKERREKTVPLTDWCRAWLTAELAGVPPAERFYLDDGRGARCYTDPHSLVRLIARLRELAHAPTFRMHGLRRQGATELLERGADLQTVSDLLGHATVQITAQAYAGHLPGRKRAAVALLPDPLSPGKRVSAPVSRKRKALK